MGLDPVTRVRFAQVAVFALTFLSYAAFHATRKSFSVSKTSLKPGDPDGPYDPTDPGWQPFTNNPALLGYMDTIFLGVKAVSMPLAGRMASCFKDTNLLACGTIGATVACSMVGLAYYWEIHSLAYFIFCFAFLGVSQAFGFPTNIAVIARWFPGHVIGTVLGLWNSCASTGNILGNTLGAAGLVMPQGVITEHNWAMAMILPALFQGCAGIVVYLFLWNEPNESQQQIIDQLENDRQALVVDTGKLVDEEDDASDAYGAVDTDAQEAERQRLVKPITVWEVVRVEGVMAFSLCLFFTKFALYVNLYWLPMYLSEEGGYTDAEAANVASFFDIGSIAGGICCGYLVDKFRTPAILSAVFLAMTIPCTLLFQASVQETMGLPANIIILTLVGFFLSGPYSLIRTAVSAFYGDHPQLRGRPGAVALVCGIIDGMGTLGSALSGFVGDILEGEGWNTVFMIIVASCAIPIVMIALPIWRELKIIYGPRCGHRCSCCLDSTDQEKLLSGDSESVEVQPVR